MRLRQSPPTLLSLLAILLSISRHTNAKPYPREGSIELIARQCATPCGWSECCAAGQQCFTNLAGVAQCGTSGGATANVVAGGGYYQMITTTYIATDLVTRVSTYSTLVPGAATTSAYSPVATAQGISCPQAGQSSCGSICCAVGQVCGHPGQCVAAGGVYTSGFTSGYGGATWQYTTTAPTGVATTGKPTSTVPFQTPVGTAGGINAGASASTAGGLSGGAIAGIVIGVIVGLILLIIICGCFCCVEAFEGLFSLFGFGKKRRRTEIVEERYSRHSGAGSGTHGGWFGTGGRRPARVDRPKRKSGLGNLGAIGAGLGALALALGIKRKFGGEKTSSGSGSSYYTGSYYDTSESSSSSNSRTRQSRGSRRP